MYNNDGGGGGLVKERCPCECGYDSRQHTIWIINKSVPTPSSQVCVSTFSQFKAWYARCRFIPNLD